MSEQSLTTEQLKDAYDVAWATIRQADNYGVSENERDNLRIAARIFHSLYMQIKYPDQIHDLGDREAKLMSHTPVGQLDE